MSVGASEDKKSLPTGSERPVTQFTIFWDDSFVVCLILDVRQNVIFHSFPKNDYRTAR